MPTYEYQCKACGNVLEEFQSISEEPLKHCPKCNSDGLVRVLGTGVGLIFKGTGFYLTDYKKSHVSKDDGETKKKTESSGNKETPSSDAGKKP